MDMYITWGRVKPGRWSEYERLFVEAEAAIPSVAAPRARWLLRDLDDPDAGFAISLWESAEAMSHFAASPLIGAMRVNKFSEVFMGEYERHRCDVRVSSAGALERLSAADSAPAHDGHLSPERGGRIRP